MPPSLPLACFQNALASVAEEMGAALARSAYSPNIKERRDFSCALFDADGRLVAQAAHIPVHLGAMPMSVAAARAFVEQSGGWSRGDLVLLNDPFAGGTHLPDLTLVSPVFLPADVAEGRSAPSGEAPFAFLASRAHHADVGGMSPGSMPLSREIYQEGIRLPPHKLRDAGRLNDAALAIFLANSRAPEERRGDLRAQMAAHAIGERRLLEMAARQGADGLRDGMAALLAHGERLMRALIAKIPDGDFAFEDWLDGDGLEENEEPIAIRVRVSIRGDEATVDFAGSAPERPGNLNAVEAIARSAVAYCFLCLLATPSRLSDGAPSDPPLNDGCLAPIRVEAPLGTIVNARRPRAVAAGNVETSQRIVDCVFGALARALPDIVPAASQGTMNNLTLGGVDPRGERGEATEPGALAAAPRAFAYYETMAGGMGARPTANGASAVHTHMTNTLNTPAEALEFAYPLRVERCEIVDGSGGAGLRRGGDGMRRDIRALAPATGALLTERRRFAPWGLAGGEPGARGVNLLIRDSVATPLPGKTTLELRAGDVVSVQTPGGGGWGEAENGHKDTRTQKPNEAEERGDLAT